MVCFLKKTNLIYYRAGKGAFFMAEQLRLEHAIRKGATIHSYEREMLAGAVIVQRTSYQFFAGPNLTLDQNSALGVGDLSNQFVDLLHP